MASKNHNQPLIKTHQASQYLAAAAINYLDKRDDDSHSNLNWEGDKKCIESRRLNEEGLLLALCLENWNLAFKTEDRIIEELSLMSASHKDILNWIRNCFKDFGFPSFKFNFHYELPYPKITDNYLFETVDSIFVDSYSSKLTMSKDAIQEFLQRNSLQSEVRIWPHHFDLGFFTEINNELSLGGGMAIPDAVSENFYLYASVYRGHESLSPPNSMLAKGRWVSGEFTGAILPFIDLELKDIRHFYNEVREIFLKK